MFDIINNIVKELTIIRNYQLMTTQFPSMQYNNGQNDMNCSYEISHNAKRGEDED